MINTLLVPGICDIRMEEGELEMIFDYVGGHPKNHNETFLGLAMDFQGYELETMFYSIGGRPKNHNETFLALPLRRS